MRTLTDLELREYEKTFDFISFYIGCARFMKAKSIHDIRFDNAKPPSRLISFITKHFQDNLVKVNLAFNETTQDRKKEMIQRLITYCFNNRVQPYKLRVIGFKSYHVEKSVEPEVSVYYGAA